MTRIAWASVGLLLTVSALLGQATETPLARLRIEPKKVGWDSVELGMSLVQTERRVGLTLALRPGVAGRCGAYGVDIDRGTLRLSLGFPSPKPGAKLESLYVNFEGYQVLAKRVDLVAELKRVAPQASYFPDPRFPDLREEEAADPTYELPGEGGWAVRIEPGRGLLLTMRSCIG